MKRRGFLKLMGYAGAVGVAACVFYNFRSLQNLVWEYRQDFSRFKGLLPQISSEELSAHLQSVGLLAEGQVRLDSLKQIIRQDEVIEVEGWHYPKSEIYMYVYLGRIVAE